MSVEYFPSPAQKLFKFQIKNFKYDYGKLSFFHSFKIMRIPQPEWSDVILPRNAQAIHSGRREIINIAYIRCINSREPEAF